LGNNFDLRNNIYHEKLLEMIYILIVHKAEINAKNLNGETPLLLLIKRNMGGENLYVLVEHHLECGADPTIKNNEGISALSLSEEYNNLKLYKSLKSVAKNLGKCGKTKSDWAAAYFNSKVENFKLQFENTQLRKDLANAQNKLVLTLQDAATQTSESTDKEEEISNNKSYGC
jgi:ankyrin repeat protein